MTLPAELAKEFHREIARVGHAVVRQLLTDYGVKNIAALPPDRRQQLLDRLKELPDG